MAQAVTVHVLRQVLELLHPVAPFVTEKLWSVMRERGWFAGDRGALIRSDWPVPDAFPEAVEAARTMASLQELVAGLRNLRARNAVPDRKPARAAVRLPDDAMTAALDVARPWFERLSRTELLGFSTTQARPENSDADVLTLESGGAAEVYLSLEGLIDKEARAADLRKKIDKNTRQASGLEKRLASDGFVSKAPTEVVQKERDKLAALQQEIERLESALQELSG